MERYRNLSGDSGVRSYELLEEGIKVAFIGVVYIYTNQITGKKHVDKMRELAIKGKGLATYINQNVKQSYATKQSA